MFNINVKSSKHIFLPAALLAGTAFGPCLNAQTAKPPSATATATAPANATSAAAGSPAAAHALSTAAHSRYQPNRVSHRAGLYYGLVWGVDNLIVRSVESGEIVRFSYHVIDAAKAQQLNDQRSEPSLIDPAAGVSLVVPSLEQVGLLRQRSAALTGKQYWMAFSNKGRKVKRGDRVDIVIGKFHAQGLEVE